MGGAFHMRKNCACSEVLGKATKYLKQKTPPHSGGVFAFLLCNRFLIHNGADNKERGNCEKYADSEENRRILDKGGNHIHHKRYRRYRNRIRHLCGDVI